MPTMFLEPVTRQFPHDFTEKHLDEQVSRDINRVLDVCKSKICETTLPHTIVGLVKIMPDNKEHLTQITQTYADAAELWNNENQMNKGSDRYAPVFLYVQQTNIGINFLAGTYEPLTKEHIGAINHAETQKIGELELPRAPEKLEFELNGQAYQFINERIKQVSGKYISELLDGECFDMLKAIWAALNTDGKIISQNITLDGKSDFGIENITTGATISFTFPNKLQKTVDVVKITTQTENSVSFFTDDGKQYRILFDQSSGLRQISEVFIAPDAASDGFRLPNEVCETRVGDCDEISLLAAAFLKKAGYAGDISLIQFIHSDYSESHAFLLSLGKGKDAKYYRVDFTLRPTITEVVPVFEAEGKIDLKKTIEKSYEKSSGKTFKVNFVRKLDGLDEIESYAYARKGAEFLSQYVTNISASETSDYGFILLGAYEKFLTKGLEINPKNDELLTQKSILWLNWRKAYKEKITPELLVCKNNECEADLTFALELQPRYALANYWYGRLIYAIDKPLALKHAQIAHEENTNNTAFKSFYEQVKNEIKR